MEYVGKQALTGFWARIKAYIDNRFQETPPGLVTFEVDASGNLYMLYQTGARYPNFEYDSATGNLYQLMD